MAAKQPLSYDRGADRGRVGGGSGMPDPYGDGRPCESQITADCPYPAFAGTGLLWRCGPEDRGWSWPAFGRRRTGGSAADQPSPGNWTDV
jgi:hypothetical protein